MFSVRRDVQQHVPVRDEAGRGPHRLLRLHPRPLPLQLVADPCIHHQVHFIFNPNHIGVKYSLDE